MKNVVSTKTVRAAREALVRGVLTPEDTDLARKGLSHVLNWEYRCMTELMQKRPTPDVEFGLAHRDYRASILEHALISLESKSTTVREERFKLALWAMPNP